MSLILKWDSAKKRGKRLRETTAITALVVFNIWRVKKKRAIRARTAVMVI